MNPYILHGLLQLVFAFALWKMKPTNPTENQYSVIGCLGLFSYSFNLTLVALFSSTHDMLWLTLAWGPVFGFFAWALWGMWKS